MKISQMTTDQAADVLVRIADPAANIMQDADTLKVIERLATGNEKPFDFIAQNLVPVITVLLKDHRIDVFEIVAALSGKAVKDVAEQKITVTIKDIKESWDGDLIDFFASLKG